MPYFKNPENFELFYQDYGQGQPVILIHGWPLSHQAWEYQMPDLVKAGFRVIAYDRRGFGMSDRPSGSYDYTKLASDLRALILELDLHDCILVGFSMGGGEVVRYFTEFGSDRIAKAVLISSIIPLVPQKSDNPDGVPEDVLNQIMDALKSDRVSFLKQRFVNDYYNADETGISQEHLDFTWSIAANASALATVECAKAWGGTDFRPECKNVTVPTLIIHGTADNIVPIATAGDQAAEMIPESQYEKIDGAPHGLNVTHKKETNRILLDFLKK